MRGKPGQVVARGEDNQGGGQDIPRYLLSRGGGGGQDKLLHRHIRI